MLTRRLLIVEDDARLRTIVREFARIRARGLPFRVETREAGDLETALALLPQVHAVLCDGSFPETPRDLPGCNWQKLSNACDAHAIPFVLLSGDDVMVGVASQRGVMAYSKTRTPFLRIELGFPPIDTLLRALGAESCEARRSTPVENPRVLEMNGTNQHLGDEEEVEDDLHR